MNQIVIKNKAQWIRFNKVGQKYQYWIVTSQGESTERITRTVTHSQSNSFAMDNHPNISDKSQSSWLDYPKAYDIQFNNTKEGESTVIIVFNPIMDNYMCYKPISEVN